MDSPNRNVLNYAVSDLAARAQSRARIVCLCNGILAFAGFLLNVHLWFEVFLPPGIPVGLKACCAVLVFLLVAGTVATVYTAIVAATPEVRRSSRRLAIQTILLYWLELLVFFIGLTLAFLNALGRAWGVKG